CGSEGGGKPLTLRAPPSIRAALAAGAIPPPLFFARRRHASIIAPDLGPSEYPKHLSVDHAVERPARLVRAATGHRERKLRAWQIRPLQRKRGESFLPAPSSTKRVAGRCAALSATSKKRSRVATVTRR